MSIHYSHVAIAISTALLFGCGGGSDSGGSSSDDSITTQSASAISTQFVSGQIISDSGAAIAEATVNLTFQDSSGEALSELATTTDDQGFYSVSVPDEKADEHLAARLIVEVEKLGYVSNEKSISVDEDSTRVSINATLAQAQVASVKRDDLDTVAVSANGVPSLMFSLVKNSSGEKRLVVGEVSPAADEDVQLSVNLPVSNIDEGVSVINSEVAYFDSSDPTDIQSFPGEFVGQGNTENQGQGVSFERADDDESYRLISSTFSQIKLTDEDDNALPLSDVQASAGESPYITMMVPKGSYPTIQSDFDTSTDGIQIPIYIYSGWEGWQYIGNGVLVNDSAGNTTTSTDDIPIDDEGNITLTGNETLQLYVKVTITDANEWIQWINLDWPIKTGTNTEMCLTGTVRYNNGENYYGSATINLPDGGTEWAYVSNGEYRLDTLVSSANDADPLDGSGWSISVYNYKTYENESGTVPALLTTPDCNTMPDLVLANPYVCKVEGHTYQFDGVTPSAYQYVSIDHARGWDWAYSDENGYYDQAVLCDSEFDISALGQVKTDQQVTSAEVSKTIDFTKTNQPPLLGALIRGSTDITIDENIDLRWSVSDPDDDDVTVDISCETDESCEIDRSDNQAVITFSTEGVHTLLITATDNQEHEEGVSEPERRFTVNVRESDNFAPEIIAFSYDEELYNDGDVISVQEGTEVALGSVTRDRNGDNVTYEWQGACISTTDSCDASGLGVGEHEIQLTITDDHSSPLSTSATITVSVQEDQAPTIELLTANPMTVGSDGTNNIDDIGLVALVDDDFTANSDLTLSWELRDAQEQDVSSLLGGSSDSNITLAAGTVPIGTYTVTLTVMDDAATPNSTEESTQFEVLENTPPSVSISSGTTELEVLQDETYAEAVVIQAVVSDDDGVENLTLAWAMSEDDTDMTEQLSLSEDSLQATIAANTLGAGSYVVELTATDGSGFSDTAQLTLLVEEDTAPTIQSITVNPQNPIADDSGMNESEIVLTATVQDDSDESPVIEWSFSPQISATTESNTATIEAGSLATGSYQATVTVTDDEGQSTQQSTTFSVIEFSGNIGIIIE